MTVSNQKPNHKQLLAIADDKVNKAREIASRDPHRLNYHIMAPANWINDPNGLIQFKGSYHVFYQHHPFGVEWGPMHWGHATSPDLVHWEHQPIALAPSETYDHGGCFSGSAVEHEDKMYLFYTGVVYDGAIHTSNRHNRKEVQCMAVSNDGRTFEKHPASPILSNPPADGSKDFRDPKVWKYGNQWYMVVGSTKNGVGKVLIYESLDLVHWSYKGVALESSGTEGYMWECPDLFPLGGKHVLLVSPMGMERRKTIYYIGEFNYDTGRFIPEAVGEMDYGTDFYAAQTFEDDEGRRLAIGWMDCWGATMPTQQGGWAGALTLPRVLTLDRGNKLKIMPAQELETLRREPVQFNDIMISTESAGIFTAIKGDSLEMMAHFDLSSCSATTFGIKLRVSEDGQEETVISYDTLKNEVTFDRTKADSTGNPGISTASAEALDGNVLMLHIFLDRSSVELFINDGQSVISNRIYPRQDSQGVELFSIGGMVKLQTLKVWNMDSSWQ